MARADTFFHTWYIPMVPLGLLQVTDDRTIGSVQIGSRWKKVTRWPTTTTSSSPTHASTIGKVSSGPSWTASSPSIANSTGGRTLTYFFDTRDIPNFASWETEIFQKHLVKARLFLAFLSPAYFASEVCRCEWRAWIDREISLHVLGDGVAPIYFIEVPGMYSKPMLSEHDVARKVAELCQRDPHERFVTETGQIVGEIRRRQLVAKFVDQAVQPFQASGRTALQLADLQDVLKKLAENLDQRSQDVIKAEASDNEVPAYNPRFTGRYQELLDLRKRLTDNGTGVVAGIHGLGGIGKTELAFTYAHAFAGVYPGGRYYIPCEYKTSLREAVLHLGGYQAFHPRISDEERKNPSDYFAAIVRVLKDRIKSLGRVVLILDNVTHADLVSRQQTDCLTTLGGELHLLATTRLVPMSESGWIVLGELSHEDALTLMERYRRFDNDAERAAAETIVHQLGGFALAIELVGAGLAAHPTATYVGLAEGIGLDDLDTLAEDTDFELRRHNHERRLQAVLEPTLALLTDEQRRTVEFAAFLPPDITPLPWLKELAITEFPQLSQRDKLKGDLWENECDWLVRVGLFARVEEETTNRRLVKVHRLVQELVRRELSPQLCQQRQEQIHHFIGARCAVIANTTKWQEARWEIEALEAVAWVWDDANDPQTAWLMNQIATLWCTLSAFLKMEPLIRRSLAINQQRLGPSHPNVASVLNNLVVLLKGTNRLAEAEPLIRRALAIDEQKFGPDHPNLAIRLSNLADLLQDTNRLAEAESLMRRALAINEQSFGPDHPNVATALNNLAHLLTATNRLVEAESLIGRALAIDEQNFGPDHPDVATELNNLAYLLMATNRLEDAEPLYRRALAIDEQSFGQNDPNVARDLHNLGQLFKVTNRLPEAESRMARAVAIFCQITRDTGHCHPRLIGAIKNYQRLLEQMQIPEPEQWQKLLDAGVEPAWLP